MSRSFLPFGAFCLLVTSCGTLKQEPDPFDIDDVKRGDGSVPGVYTVEPTRDPTGDSRDTETELEFMRPNILFVLVDDLGWTGISSGKTNLSNGSDYHKTPNIDALAEQGVSFSAAYAAPTCAPARAGILTGQRTPKTKYYANVNVFGAANAFRELDPPKSASELDPSAVTFAEALQEAGYRTALFGKWHFGSYDYTTPLDHGFEVNIGGTTEGVITGGAPGPEGMHGSSHFAQHDGSWSLPGLPANGKAGQMISQRLTDEALSWIDQADSRPWMAMVSHYSVHKPIEAHDEDFEAVGTAAESARHTNRTYAAMVRNLDTQLGRLIDHLENAPDPRDPSRMLIENTLVIFFSDNGGLGGYSDVGVTFVGSDEVIVQQFEVTNQKPLSVGKSTTWEGGVRVPLIVRWDRSSLGGSVVNEPVQYPDLYATMMDLTETSPGAHVVDGVSLSDALGGNVEALEERPIFLHMPVYSEWWPEAVAPEDHRFILRPVTVMWQGDWKLSWFYQEQSWHLVHLAEDIGETRDLSCEQKIRLKEMGETMVDWLVAESAELPTIRDTREAVPLPDPAVCM